MYKYELHKGSKKWYCPSCGKKRFVRYVYSNTNELLPSKIGKCDRYNKCAYHLKPREYFNSIGVAIPNDTLTKQTKRVIKKHSLHSNSLVERAGNNFKKNNFISYLKTIFTKEQVERIILRFLIGSSNNWNGATVFWQIDENIKVRAGKVMLYNSKNGKRVKKPYPHITWVHSILKKKKKINDFNLNQCLFGLHQVVENSKKPIAIVESEKTACIMSEIFDKYLYMSCGSLSNINDKMFKPIKNRKIVLYPDASNDNMVFKKWSEKAKNLKKRGYDISISSLLKDNCNQEQQNKGLDIADFFVREKINLSEEDIIYNKLLKKNPNIKKLVNSFGLTKNNGQEFCINNY